MPSRQHALSGWERVVERIQGLTDTAGNPLRFCQSHRLRHTRATELLNDGCPDPGGAALPRARVPEMPLRYAATCKPTIDRFRGDPYLTGLRFTRELRLLDLAADSTGAWPTRAGGTFALSTGPHSITQRWARRITDAFPDLDGLRYNSRFAGQPCIALFAPAETAMPTRPAMSLPLSHPGLALRIAAATQRLGYFVF